MRAYRLYTCILAFFQTQLGVTNVSLDFSSPSQTAFMSSENPFFGLGHGGYVRAYLRTYVPPLYLVRNMDSHWTGMQSERVRKNQNWHVWHQVVFEKMWECRYRLSRSTTSHLTNPQKKLPKQVIKQKWRKQANRSKGSRRTKVKAANEQNKGSKWAKMK